MARKASACWAGGIRDAGPFAFIRLFPNLKPSLALDDDLAVQRAQFELANVTASGVGLFGDHGRALQAASGLALCNVFAKVDSDCRRHRIEVRLKHEGMIRL